MAAGHALDLGEAAGCGRSRLGGDADDRVEEAGVEDLWWKVRGDAGDAVALTLARQIGSLRDCPDRTSKGTNHLGWRRARRGLKMKIFRLAEATLVTICRFSTRVDMKG